MKTSRRFPAITLFPPVNEVNSALSITMYISELCSAVLATFRGVHASYYTWRKLNAKYLHRPMAPTPSLDNHNHEHHDQGVTHPFVDNFGNDPVQSAEKTLGQRHYFLVPDVAISRAAALSQETPFLPLAGRNMRIISSSQLVLV
jgi:hypothetical protein